MKYLSFLCLLFISSYNYGQTFSTLINSADSLYNAKNYQESGKVFNEAFNLSEGISSDYYNAACSWSLAGDTIFSIKYITLAAEKGWQNKKWLESDSDLTFLHNTIGWATALNIVQENIDEYEKDFDKPLKKQLELIYIRDQTLRQLYTEAQDKFGKDSDEMNYFWSLVSEQDSLNEIEVIKILDEKGWVGKSLVGGQANMTIWLVIQHAPLDIQEKYLPMMKESVLKGESNGRNLALLEDRVLMRNGKPQTYGSQIQDNKETGEKEVYEIIDPEYVNQRRKEVGLSPLEDYVKNWGIEWTIEQKEK